MVRHHYAVAGHIHHTRRHHCSKDNTGRGDDEHGAELSNSCADSRLEKVDSVVTHSYEEVKYRKAEQEDDNT